MISQTDTCLPTPEMVRQLNLEVIVTPSGKCLSARTKNKTILDELMDKGYIESYHAEYGLTFHILREVWLGKLSTQTAMLSDAIRTQCPQNSPSEVYDHVYRITGAERTRIIFWAVERPAEPVIALAGEIYRRAFERLADAFTDTHKLLGEKK